MARIAIHGFGRIGRSLIKVALKRDLFFPVSISDIKDVGTLAALFEVDSNYGRWPVEVGEIRTAASALVGSNADADLVHWIVAAAAAKIVVHHRRSLAELRRAQVIDWAAEVRVIQ